MGKDDPFNIYEKSPHLRPGYKPPEQKLKLGFLVDYAAKSPELLRPRMRVSAFNKGMVYDASKSPELRNTRESIMAGQVAQDLDAQARQEGGGVPAGPGPEAAAPSAEIPPALEAALAGEEQAKAQEGQAAWNEEFEEVATEGEEA